VINYLPLLIIGNKLLFWG